VRRKPKILRKRLAILLGVAALIWLGVMLVGGSSGALALVRARSIREELAERVRRLEDENARLRQEIGELRRDPEAIVRVAREELDMARPDEEVILVQPAAVDGQ